jgi:predicted MFS family arabinose efflux permease
MNRSNAGGEAVAPGGGLGDAAGGRGRVVLLVLAAVQFTNIVDFMIVMPLGPQLMRTMGIDPARFGLIVSSYTFSACAAGLLAATVVDRFDRKRAFLTLYAGFLIGTLSCGLVNGYAALLAARVVTGAFGGILGGMALAIIGDVFPEHRRGAATGALMSAFAVASVVGVPAGLFLGNTFDWHAPFLALAALAALVLPVASRALPDLRGHLAARPPGGTLAELRGTLTHPDHLRAFALVATLMLGGFLVIPYISPYLVANVGVREKDLPLLYVAGGVLTLFSAPTVGRLADRFGKLRVYRVAAPVSAALMLTMTHLPRVPLAVAVAACAALMVGNSGRMVVAMAMVTSCVEPRRRGSFMSLNSAVQHFSTGLGAYLGGLIIVRDRSGLLTHYGRVGWLAVAATVLSLFLAARLRPHQPAAPPHHTTEDVAADLDGPTPAPAVEVV